MKKKEREEIIKVLRNTIDYIQENLEDTIFLCYLGTFIRKTDASNIPIKCGYNDRMVPLTIEYVKSQKPTARKNKEHYYAVTYKRNPPYFISSAWWDYGSFLVAFGPHRKEDDIRRIATNMDKIRFLQHLVNKLNNK